MDVSIVESAIIAQLKAELPYLKNVDVLASLLADDSPDYALLAPAAFVSYTGGPYKRVGTSSTFDHFMKFIVIIVQRNFVSQKRLLHGTATSKGVYEVLDDVRNALTDETCGVAIQPLTPVDDQGLEATRDVVVWGFSFQTRARAQKE